VAKNLYQLLVLVILALSLSATVPSLLRADDDTRATYPSAISVEGLGRAVMYSVQFDQMATEDFGGGIGIGSAGTSSAIFGSPSTVAIPIYINGYLMRSATSLFVTGGATLLTNTDVEGLKANVSNLTYPTSSVLPNAGVGLEIRGDAGFLLRATGYVLFGSNTTPWFGLSVGWVF
jgi:hypothetical protein